MIEKDYTKAMEHLNDLRPLETDQWRTIYALLQTIICKMELEIHYDVTRYLNQLVELITSSSLNPEVLLKEAENFVTEGKYYQAFGLYFSAAKLHCKIQSEESTKEIKLCVDKIHGFIAPLVVQDEKVLRMTRGHVIPALKEIQRSMRKISGEIQSRENAWCTLRIACLLKACGDVQQSIEELCGSINLLKRQDPTRILGLCLNNLGTAYYTSGKMEKAKESYNQAIDVFKNAVDLCDDVRNDDIEKAQRNLSIVQK